MKQGFTAKLSSIVLVAALALIWPIVATAANPEIAPPLAVADQYMLAIPQSGFGKDYLFTASLIPQQQAATSRGLAGKIVRFEAYPDSVDMYESTQGLVVTEQLPARRLLASFPIVRRDGDQVVVDFNKGMRRVFTQGWTDGGLSGLADHNSTLEVPESRVFSVQTDGSQLVIRQSVQTRSREYDQDTEAQFEVRYFLSPYQPGNFAGKEPDKTDARYTRYFETEGQIEPGTGRISTRIARFDTNQPVAFYYSANTPPEYVQAVKDGILYWNGIFGREMVTAAKAPDGVTAPDAQYNLIQWVPWDRAGFAYADILLDPLNGESKHGQVYLTSAFSFSGKARARALLRAFQEIAAPKKDDKKGAQKLSLPFLSSAECCESDPAAFAAQMANGLQAMLATDALDDAAALRASQDYVREVVAHEVGHILGLRHNFAGSLGATLTSKELDDWFNAYLSGRPLDSYTNKIASTSVMEYTVFKGAVFTGWLMRTVKQPMPHDHAAIAWGYFDNPEARTNKMLFASDEDVGIYGDVKRFDYGRDPVVSAYTDAAKIIDLLPNMIIETFISARAPQNPNDRVPLEQVPLEAPLVAGALANDLDDELQWFKSDTRSLRVENDFDYIGDLNRKARLAAHWKYLNTQIQTLGGVDRAVFSDLPDAFKLDLGDEPAGQEILQRLSSTNLTARLGQLLQSTNYLTFVGLDDKKYSFTEAERALILERGRKFFEALEKELVKQICKRLTNAPRDLGAEAGTGGTVSEDDITAKLEQRIIAIAGYVITTPSETNRIAGKVDKSEVSVPVFQYDQETRLAAAAMLGEKNGSFSGWADDAKSDLNKQLRKQVEDALNISHFKDFTVSLLSRPLRDWYQQQQAILAALPSAPGSPPPLPSK
ncbi:MAG TPA: zinc-dependent metalloprotease [Candidatus Acidoferrum sp.]|nr:zinc-dependent metalloprotease [Candidatus Acidoferrum sp.]